MLAIRIDNLVKPLVALIALVILCGCQKPDSNDQFECINRAVYGFNKGADRVVIKPVARVYQALLPLPVKKMVGNFFQNLGEIPNVANDLLQADFAAARSDAARFILNSTWGMAGLFDIAQAKGNLAPHRQDFGLTLARWGYTDSRYVVLPFFGPSTVRDSLARVPSYYMSLPAYLHSVRLRNQLLLTQYVDIRAGLLKIEPALDEAIDEYVFVRNAYYQHRDHEIKGYETQEETQRILEEGPPE